MIVEGSGRVADVIAQVSNLPSHKISICLIQKKLSIFFKDSYELFTENKIVEWTKKVSLTIPIIIQILLILYHKELVNHLLIFA